jgi:hypothetical protein
MRSSLKATPIAKRSSITSCSRLAEDQFGSFYDLKGIINDDAKITAFVATHDVYADSDASKAILKVKFFYNSLLRRINETFFGYTTNSTYASSQYLL